MKILKAILKAIPIFMMVLLVRAPADAAITTIILSGSDTISLHAVTSEAAAAYKFLSNGSTGAVALVNDFGAAPGYGGGGFGAFTSLSPAAFATATLGDFAGIMFASPGECCSDPSAFVGSRAAELATYVLGGGNLYVEDYEGKAVWDAIIGVPAGTGVAGLVISTGCTGDPGVATLQGASFGFVGGSFGCYIHQIYNPAVFAPFGFVSLVDSGIARLPGTVILGSGEAAVPAGVPEPATLGLFGLGALAVGFLRRRKQTQK